MELSGLSLAITNVLGGRLNPLSWFAAGEQGAWYDPSDLTSLYQDSAGTMPMSAVGTVADQPVGLMLDKSKGLVLGAELITNGDFSNGTTGWASSSGFASSALVVSGEFQVTATSGYGRQIQSISCVVGRTYKVSCTARVISGSVPALIERTSSTGSGGFGAYPNTVSSSATTLTFVFTATSNTEYICVGSGTGSTGQVMGFDNISVKEIAGNHAFQAATTNRPLLSARVNLLLATATLSTQSVTSQATNYTLTFTGTGTVTLSGTATGTLSAGSNTFTATAGTLTLTVSGSVTLADLRPTNSGALLPPYQRVNTASDYDAVGFPLYLKCNSTSSAMSTNSINFTTTDKMTVVTGVRKLASGLGVLCETSADASSYNGSFFITAPRNTSDYSCLTRGTTIFTEVTVSGYVAPITNVVSSLVNIAGPSNAMKINGVQVGNATTTLGGGFYGNYPLYLFTRSGNQYPFNGQFYGAIIRGAQSDTASVTQTENYMATKTGITF